jgi:hypothetical protein
MLTVLKCCFRRGSTPILKLSLFILGASASLFAQPTLLPEAVQGTAYSVTLGITGGVWPYHAVLSPGSILPQGLELSDNPLFGTGQIAGTPQVYGRFNFSVNFIDSSGSPFVQTRQYSLVVHLNGPFQFVVNSLPDATYGAPYAPVLLVDGGTPPYSGWFTGSPPVSFVVRNGELVTSQVLDFPGTHQLTIQAEHSSFPAQRISQTFSITVRAGLTLAQSIHNGTLLSPYSSGNLLSTNGTPPYTFSLAAGGLPPGVQLDLQAGVLTGTPTRAGSYTFTIGVTDSAGLNGSQSYTITINESTLTIAPQTLPIGRVGVAYPNTLFTVGGGFPENRCDTSARKSAYIV